MKVALVGPGPPFRGGIAQHTCAIHRALSTHHVVQVHPFARLYPRALFPGTTQTAPGDLPELPADVAFDPYRPASWSRVAQRIDALDPDLVLLQWWHPWFAVPAANLLRQLARALGGRERLSLLCHNVLPHKSVPLERVLASWVLRQSGHAIVHAEREARSAARLAPGVHVHRMWLPALLPMAHVARDDARAALGLHDGPWVLLFGMLREYKGLSDLLRALALPSCRGVSLLVLGEFYESELRHRRAVRRLGLEGRVRLVNRYVPSSEVGVAFAAADVVVLPYRDASQSSVLPLAVGARRPVVVTDTGGLPEAARGVGRVVPPGDAEALAEALAGTLQGPLIEERCFLAAEQRFSLQSAREALEKIAGAGRALTARGGTLAR